MSKGYIYIMTNPSFTEYVKIGYAKNVEQRLNELNSSTAVPFAFRVYATYEVDSALSDKKLHSILDKLDPDLRSVERVNGKVRTREFYAMSPEDAYDILEAIAEINNLTDKLKKWEPTEEEKDEKKQADEIRSKAAPLVLAKIGIAVGETLVYCNENNPHNGETCVVYDDRRVDYNGEIYSLSGLAKEFSGSADAHIAGPRFFKYKDEWLNEIRERVEKSEKNF